jgi:hypothetical protein
MTDDLIKRSDVLFMIDAFERDFEQSWRVQFRANIYAIPAVKDDRIEQLEEDRGLWKSRYEHHNHERLETLSLNATQASKIGSLRNTITSLEKKISEMEKK